VPLVNQARLFLHTPAAWVPAAAAAALFAAAWLTPKWRVLYAVGVAAEIVFVLWFFHGGAFPWGQGDWRQAWTYLVAWREALQQHTLPFYVRAAAQGTERYFANLETLSSPDALLLGVISVDAFLPLHLMLVFAIGSWGAVEAGRALDLRGWWWAAFVTLFALNGHILAHLSVGHLAWVSYYLLPWIFFGAVRLWQGRPAPAVWGATLGGMILLGGWHVFVSSLLFVALASVERRQFAALARTAAFAAGLAAFRILPGIATFATGTNQFIGGFPSAGAMLAALVSDPAPSRLLEPWEFDTYIGYAGLAILCAGAARLALPTFGLIALSYGDVYGRTLFRLPGFVSERVTSRMLILPVLWLTLVGCTRLDRWLPAREHPSRLRTAGAIAFAVVLVVQLALRAATWRPAPIAGPDLPAMVLKQMPIEPVYAWTLGVGALLSAATAAALVVRR